MCDVHAHGDDKLLASLVVYIPLPLPLPLPFRLETSNEPSCFAIREVGDTFVVTLRLLPVMIM